MDSDARGWTRIRALHRAVPGGAPAAQERIAARGRRAGPAAAGRAPRSPPGRRQPGPPLRPGREHPDSPRPDLRVWPSASANAHPGPDPGPDPGPARLVRAAVYGGPGRCAGRRARLCLSESLFARVYLSRCLHRFIRVTACLRLTSGLVRRRRARGGSRRIGARAAKSVAATGPRARGPGC